MEDTQPAHEDSANKIEFTPNEFDEDEDENTVAETVIRVAAVWKSCRAI